MICFSLTKYLTLELLLCLQRFYFLTFLMALLLLLLLLLPTTRPDLIGPKRLIYIRYICGTDLSDSPIYLVNISLRESFAPQKTHTNLLKPV